MAEAIARFGESVVADRAGALLGGANEGEDFLLWVGGRHAQGILDGAPALYWPEVWGARALLYAWDPAAEVAIREGMRNQAWRVREMCCRVAAERSLPLADVAAELFADDTARVRAAAVRVVGVSGDFDQAVAARALLRDPEIEVRRAAGNALAAAAERLGRPIE
jgi:hypothetical protein